VRDEGLASLTTLDSALGSLGSLTGLPASDLMLVQVVMLARIPWVARAGRKANTAPRADPYRTRCRAGT
jgi:hypothetical protein